MACGRPLKNPGKSCKKNIATTTKQKMPSSNQAATILIACKEGGKLQQLPRVVSEERYHNNRNEACILFVTNLH
jgi:hypothetical protein